MRISMENSQQEFQVDIDESFDPWVMGDARRIRQVLVNILENASKYTGQRGKITFSVCEFKKEEQRTGTYRLSLIHIFHADQFACLLERRWEYTDELFIRCNARVNTLPNARNVVMKWGIYQVADRNVSVEQMCDRALLAARSIKGRYGTYFAAYDDQLRNRLLREQAITDLSLIHISLTSSNIFMFSLK